MRTRRDSTGPSPYALIRRFPWALPVLFFIFGTTLSAQLEVRPIENPSVVVESSATAQISVTAEDIKRQPVAVRRVGSSNVWELIGDGRIWVRVTAIDFDNKTFEEKTLEVVSDKIEDDDSPFDPPDPPQPGDYDGPNRYGLGQLSFDTAPGYNADVVRIYKAAGEYLYGRPSQKVMWVERDDPRADSDYLVANWLRNQMTPIVQGNGDWRKWYESVMQRAFKLNGQAEIVKIEDWYSAWNEIAAGVEALK